MRWILLRLKIGEIKPGKFKNLDKDVKEILLNGINTSRTKIGIYIQSTWGKKGYDNIDFIYSGNGRTKGYADLLHDANEYRRSSRRIGGSNITISDIKSGGSYFDSDNGVIKKSKADNSTDAEAEMLINETGFGKILDLNDPPKWFIVQQYILIYKD